jgi:lipoate-protein ligase A
LETWRLLPFKIANAFENMAMDEALFRVLQEQGGPPVLRFYGWEKPSLSVGYSQDLRDGINLRYCRQSGIDVVRRPTGGKAVLHDRELTYAVVSREKPPFTPAGLIRNYQAIGLCLIRGFSALGIDVRMAGDKPGNEKDVIKNRRPVCFAVPAPFELLSRGRKICGSAQVRSRGCFLQHGSILLEFDGAMNGLVFANPHDLGNDCPGDDMESRITSVRAETGASIEAETLSAVMERAFLDVWNIRFMEGEPTMKEQELKKDLMRNKYTNPSWNEGPFGSS